MQINTNYKINLLDVEQTLVIILQTFYTIVILFCNASSSVDCAIDFEVTLNVLDFIHSHTLKWII